MKLLSKYAYLIVIMTITSLTPMHSAQPPRMLPENRRGEFVTFLYRSKVPERYIAQVVFDYVSNYPALVSSNHQQAQILQNGKTLAHILVDKNYVGTLKTLVESTTEKLNSRRYDGRSPSEMRHIPSYLATPLLILCAQKYMHPAQVALQAHIIQIIIRKAPDVLDIPRHDGMTPIVVAMLHDNVHLMSALQPHTNSWRNIQYFQQPAIMDTILQQQSATNTKRNKHLLARLLQLQPHLQKSVIAYKLQRNIAAQEVVFYDELLRRLEPKQQYSHDPYASSVVMPITYQRTYRR